jgi:hypothetical protein
MEEKMCKACEESFPATVEYFHKKGNGLTPRCRPCNNAYKRSLAAKPEAREKKKVYMQEYFMFVENIERNKTNKRRRYAEDPELRLKARLRADKRKKVLLQEERTQAIIEKALRRGLEPQTDKECCKCGETKPMTDEFFQYLKSSVIYRSYCRACENENREYIAFKDKSPESQQLHRDACKKYFKTVKGKAAQKRSFIKWMSNPENYTTWYEAFKAYQRERYRVPEIRDKIKAQQALYRTTEAYAKVYANMLQNLSSGREEMTDAYMRQLLSGQGIKADETTPELIELKRINLKLKRDVKTKIKNRNSA